MSEQNNKLNCDQVAWLLDAFGRFLPIDSHPSISQQREMQKYALLYEVMEVAGLQFLDARARWNGTPHPARDYGDEDIDFANKSGRDNQGGG